jgi:HD-GYP domain-containing protein (c-di-GMP phosphodiesterase class II)
VEEATLEMMERERGRHFDPFLYGVFQAALPELRRIARATPDEPLDPAPWAVTEVSPAALEAAAAV